MEGEYLLSQQLIFTLLRAGLVVYPFVVAGPLDPGNPAQELYAKLLFTMYGLYGLYGLIYVGLPVTA